MIGRETQLIVIRLFCEGVTEHGVFAAKPMIVFVTAPHLFAGGELEGVEGKAPSEKLANDLGELDEVLSVQALSREVALP